jgi:Tfp pilus assembly protein PilO
MAKESPSLMAELARERALVEELRDWARKLEEARDWHNEHRQMAEKALADAEAQLQQMRQSCAALRRQLPYRVLRRARILTDLQLE